MAMIKEGIFSTGLAGITYVVLTAILGGMVVFALWKGRKAVERASLRPLFVAIAAYFFGRLLVLDHSDPSLGIRLVTITIFAVLNLVTFYGLACFLLNVRSETAKGPALEKQARKPAWKRLVQQSVYFALAGGLLSLVRPPQASSTTFAVALVNFMAIGAAIRVVAFLFWEMLQASTQLRVGLSACLGLMTCAWLTYEVSPLMTDQARFGMLWAARGMDIAMLVLCVASLLSHYIRIGLDFKHQAKQSKDEMAVAKEELSKLSNIATNIYEDSSDLIRKQREQTLLSMKKVDNLEKIIQIGIAIQRRKRLDHLLQEVVDLVRDNLGFKTVTLRLFNAKSQHFETKAHVGLSEEVKDTVVNYRIPKSEYDKMVEPRFRISKSYFIRNSKEWYGEELSGAGSMLVEDTWGEIDMLIVPLLTNSNEIAGYLSVENPEDPMLSIMDVIQNLENITSLAVVAIRNARFLQELREKNKKLKGYADKLSGLNTLKSNFVATISHEFRTPLTSIKAYCDTLMKNIDEVDTELTKQFLMVIDEESGRLMSLIDDILGFAKMETGSHKFQRSLCGLNDIAKLAASELEKNFKKKRLTLHQEVNGNEVLVRADVDLMKQMIVNLLHNASKFSTPDSNVWLRIEDGTVTARIVVEDEGIGIPDDQKDVIFEQFHQVDNSSTREYGGSGLGLAICRNIVEWHDGRIWVENVDGGGARFVAVIPKKQVIVKAHVLDRVSTIRRYEVERFLELLVENVAELLNVRKASIMMLDKEENELRIECAIGLEEEIVEHGRLKPGEGIAGKVLQNGRPLLVEDIEKDSRVGRANNEAFYGSKSFMCVPIIRRGEIVGVVNTAGPVFKEVFDNDDRRLLEIFAERLARTLSMLESFTLASAKFEGVRETLKAVLESRRYVDLQDEGVVKVLVKNTAQRMGLDEEEVARIQYTMSVYDLGLTKIGYHIIKKPSELTVMERKEIENHTILGVEMLDMIETSPKIKDIVLCHHENYDGSGYPAKLKGEAIPLEARILRVADSLRALISSRPYQRQYTLDEAMEVIKHRAGTFFDPKIVNQFIQAANAFGGFNVQVTSTGQDQETEEKPQASEEQLDTVNITESPATTTEEGP
jgi:signal transduction histidine kinase/HD-GYP domain-containing protein (c-di-GMP phosphodiesterase class II)